MFNDLINNFMLSGFKSNSNISLYPVGENNLEGIKMLIENCLRLGSENKNVIFATVDPSIWLGDFLNKYWDRISYVSNTPIFEITKITNGKIESKIYNSENKECLEEELDKFFENKWKKFVLYSVVKYVNLKNLTASYMIRYSDITEKYEERDGKINDLLN